MLSRVGVSYPSGVLLRGCSSLVAVILTVTTAILPDLGEDGRCFIPRLLLLTIPG